MPDLEFIFKLHQLCKMMSILALKNTRTLYRIIDNHWSGFVSNQWLYSKTGICLATCMIQECQLSVFGHTEQSVFRMETLLTMFPSLRIWLGWQPALLTTYLMVAADEEICCGDEEWLELCSIDHPGWLRNIPTNGEGSSGLQWHMPHIWSDLTPKISFVVAKSFSLFHFCSGKLLKIKIKVMNNLLKLLIKKTK